MAQRAARRTTTTSDSSILYVCGVANETGSVILVAAAGAPSLFASSPIEVSSSITPTAMSFVTTAIAFVTGILTTFVTSFLQEKQKHRGELATITNQAQATLASTLSAEILSNRARIENFLNNGGDPTKLQLGAYNATSDAAKSAFAYLERRVDLGTYRDRLAVLYETHIKDYQKATQTWMDAKTPQDKATQLAEVKRLAVELQKHFREIG